MLTRRLPRGTVPAAPELGRSLGTGGAGNPAPARSRAAGRRDPGRDASASERGVEAPGPQGDHGRPDNRRHAASPRPVAPPMSVRLGAVLGYSGRRSDGLHAICAERLRHAEQLVMEGDTVLLSGWARRRSSEGEAELMRAAWRGADAPIISDATARNTAGNAAGVAEAARRHDVDEVVYHFALARIPSPRACPRDLAGAKHRRSGLVASRPASGRAPCARTRLLRLPSV